MARTAIVLAIGYIVAATGPFSIGLLSDVAGSITVPLWILVPVGVVTLGLTPFLKSRQMYCGSAPSRRHRGISGTNIGYSLA